MPLRDFFSREPVVAVAFSGGVDSAYLAWAAKRHARRARAYYVKSEFQSVEELAAARRLAHLIGVPLTVVSVNMLETPAVVCNGPDRCYRCKQLMLSRIAEEAAREGISCVVEGTNASDDEGDRPGMRAVREAGILSPLREAGLTKSMVRQLSRDASLPTWDKPSQTCFATRIPQGTLLTEALLGTVERAESLLHREGIGECRARIFGDAVRIQVAPADFERCVVRRSEILRALGPAFSFVMIDLEPLHASAWDVSASR